MTGDGPLGSEHSASADGAAPPAVPPAPRPFARPTPANGERPTPSPRPTPFVVPASGPRASPGDRRDRTPAPLAPPLAGDRDPRPLDHAALEPAADERAGGGRQASLEADAADVLVAVATRLRAGELRLPFRVDCRYAPAALAVVLAALHAEPAGGESGGDEPASAGGMAALTEVET